LCVISEYSSLLPRAVEYIFRATPPPLAGGDHLVACGLRNFMNLDFR